MCIRDRYKDKLEFVIIHITNDVLEDAVLDKVNPFTNDLAAPVKTLLGAYGTQTSVNDFRLQKYIASINREEVGGAHYKHISLYRPKDSMQYTMTVSYTHLDVYKRQVPGMHKAAAST